MLNTVTLAEQSASIRANQQVKNKTKSTFEFSINLVQSAKSKLPAPDTNRRQVEDFIKTQFAKCYQTELSHFLPSLVYCQQKNIKAALGLRSARSPLFIEQYLDTSIEKMIAQQQLMNGGCNRHNIVEVGNLCSSSMPHTIPLFIVVALALYMRGFSCLVFAGTSRVASILKRIGVNLHYLADANADKLTAEHRATNWGSYYQTQPKVYAMPLLPVVDLIFDNANYKKTKPCFNRASDITS